MPLEYEAIRKSFDKAASGYEGNAVLQKEIMFRMIDRLEIEPDLKPKHILDLGCGTGWAIPKLLKLYPESKFTCIDFSQNMLKQVPKQAQINIIHHDAHSLPLDDNSVDLVFSNMMLHWCNEADVFKECLRVLKHDGLLLMSALGETSLFELKQCWKEVDNQPHVNSFPALHDMGDQLLNSGYHEVVVNTDLMTLTYKDISSLMKDIQASGGQNVNEKRNKGMYSRQQLLKLTKAYNDFKQEDGLLPASYEVVYLHAKKQALSKNSIPINIKYL
jgi:malonyl-CoA O-methyltransferase